MRGLFRSRRCPPFLRFFTTTTTTTSSSKTTLVLSNVFPDPSASAAGVRTQVLLDGLAQTSKVHLATSASLTNEHQQASGKQQVSKTNNNEPSAESASARGVIEDLARRNISWSWLPPNRSQQIQDFSQQYTSVEKIVFDRFYIEEAYSFALRECYPDAALVLDMQDMHSLRGGREKIVKDWDSKNTSGDPFQVLEAVVCHIPSIDNPQLLRELGSVHRSDLTLVCSPHELHLLESTYGVASSKLRLAPFFVPTSQIQEINGSSSSLPKEEINWWGDPETAPSFVFCGGFKHAPNVDAVRLLLQVIWPRIREIMPSANLHIHGAYCPVEFQKAHCPSDKGVHVHGYTSSLEKVFGRPGSVLLAPLRFGAGIKGKIIDAWTFGMPVVTTPVGSEGMTPPNQDCFGGGIAWSLDEFVNMAAELAVVKDVYVDATRRGQDILRRMHDRATNWERVQSSIEQTMVDLDLRRRADFTQALLWHHSARSTEYFSRWIELKETTNRNESNMKPPC